MVGVLKWVYELGVKHERRRVAAYLRNTQAFKWQEVDRMERQMASIFDSSKTTKLSEAEKQQLMQRIAVERAVEEIIASIFRSQDQYVPGPSVMFPEGEKE